MTILKVERFGGFAGYGHGHLKSRGEIAQSALSPADQAAVDALFRAHGKGPPSTVVDGFSYRIARKAAKGMEMIEVPEERVPAMVRDCVKDAIE
jgi:hypothetical protein